ncbi:hypothetical protein DH2020_042562 [Rehmannia glutinosa]|uniref:S1 motif domain-containing protein n=1 Tax=Rehmannia glutinosa TaxID=99300 RepID=A0ABR0UMX4_REHGL
MSTQSETMTHSLASFGPKEKESEEEARKRNWIERGWAPWEEILTPEADFARKSSMKAKKFPFNPPKQLRLSKSVGDFLEWAIGVGSSASLRDWPPRGWEVDKEELEFIRGAHKLHSAVRLDYEKVEERVEKAKDTGDMCLERYKVFLKQYNEWVEANRDRLEEESYKKVIIHTIWETYKEVFVTYTAPHQDYYPGRRKRGKDYKEEMYELPFYYPGQICAGKVTAVHLYQGAFVDIEASMMGKTRSLPLRFPIELRFVRPNIDHLIVIVQDLPLLEKILESNGRRNLYYQITRDAGQVSSTLWQIHNAEQMILDDMVANPDKYKDKKLTELTDEEEFDEENSVEYGKAYYKKALLPKMTLKISVKELDLEAANAERQLHNKLWKEAEERGETYKITKLRRNEEMDEYDLIHWRRSFEEREALLRDISCSIIRSRQALGLPLEEPEQEERMTDAHNKSIVGKGTVWYDMSYEDAIKQQMEREKLGIKPRQYDEDDSDRDPDDEDDDDDDDFDYSILGSPSSNVSNQPHVNGTESPRLSDEGIFED